MVFYLIQENSKNIEKKIDLKNKKKEITKNLQSDFPANDRTFFK